MIQNSKFIASRACDTYTKLKRRVKRDGSFRYSMKAMCDALEDDTQTCGNDGDGDGDDNDNEQGASRGSTTKAGGAKNYKAAEVQADPRVRLGNPALHDHVCPGDDEPGKGRRSRRCPLCCERCVKGLHQETSALRCRAGYKCTLKCTACNVYLCKKSRNGKEKTCFQIWHSARNLPQLCTGQTEAVDDGRKTRAPPSPSTRVGVKRTSRTPPTRPEEAAARARRSKRRAR